MTLMLFIVLLSVVKYHTLLFISHVFNYFFVYTQFWNAKFQGVNEKNMSHLHVLVLKKVEVSRVVKKVICSSTFK